MAHMIDVGHWRGVWVSDRGGNSAGLFVGDVTEGAER